MIAADVRAEIRRLFYAEHWKVGTIAAQLAVHHDAVRAAIEAERFTSPTAVLRKSALDPFLPLIRDTLDRYPRLRATRIYEMLTARGFTGGVAQVRRLVRRLRPVPSEAYLRLSVMPGEQAQADWGSFGHMRVGHGRRPLSCFVIVLSWSRAIHAVFTLDQTLESFMRGHVDAFDAFGGVPRQILYDNLKSAVLERKGPAIHFNPRLLDLAGHYHFSPRPCTPARGNEKGRVERQIQYLRHSFFAARDFVDLADVNVQFLRWRDEIAHRRAHPDQPERTVEQMLGEERARLLPLPEHAMETDSMRVVVSGKTPYVRFDRNLYSIPHTLVRKPLTLLASADLIRVLDGQDEVGRHIRSYGTNQIVENPDHIDALVAAKRNASPLKARDRLRITVPQADALLVSLADRGENLGFHTARLTKLLDDYGKDELARAVDEAMQRQAPSAGSVAHILEKRRRARGLRPPIPMVLPTRPDLRDLDVTPHRLEDYDGLGRDDD